MLCLLLLFLFVGSVVVGFVVVDGFSVVVIFVVVIVFVLFIVLLLFILLLVVFGVVVNVGIIVVVFFPPVFVVVGVVVCRCWSSGCFCCFFLLLV